MSLDRTRDPALEPLRLDPEDDEITDTDYCAAPQPGTVWGVCLKDPGHSGEHANYAGRWARAIERKAS
jgi:hypothetical protein